MITKLYNTKISCSKYNLKITDSIIVTVKLIDFNNNPVRDEEVLLTTDGGEFINKQKSYTGTTNSDGEVEVKYTPTDWGTYNLMCNDTNIVINVRGGWKNFPITVTHKSVTSSFGQYNQDEVVIHFEGKIPKYTNTPITVLKINEGYDFLTPHTTVCVPPHGCYGEVYVTNTGKVKCIMNTVTDHWQNIHYARKKMNVIK